MLAARTHVLGGVACDVLCITEKQVATVMLTRKMQAFAPWYQTNHFASEGKGVMITSCQNKLSSLVQHRK